MNIAIDLHGTFDTETNVFYSLMNQYPEHKFFIFSGSPVADISDQLASINVIHNYTKQLQKLDVLSVVSFMHDHNFPMVLKTSPRSGKENWYFDGPEEVWWSMKAVICSLNNIHLLIDDKLEYAEYFGKNHITKFIQFKPKNVSVSMRDINNFIKRNSHL